MKTANPALYPHPHGTSACADIPFGDLIVRSLRRLQFAGVLRQAFREKISWLDAQPLSIGFFENDLLMCARDRIAGFPRTNGLLRAFDPYRQITEPTGKKGRYEVFNNVN